MIDRPTYRPPLLLPAALAFAFAGLAPAPVLADDGFRDLFDGSTLDGWVNVNCAPETWRAEDGMIRCTGKPIGALRTTDQYENFILELEWRHLRPGGNAGIFIWASPIAAEGQPFLRAIEVQVLDHAYGKSDWFTTHGDVFPIHGSRMKPHGRHRGMRSFPSEERSKGSPEWNHYRIECNDGTLRLHVNGKEVSGGSDCHWRKGYIALESEGSPVDFRNLRIKELPSTGADAGESAPEAAGHRALYTGTDLRGLEPEPAEAWKSSDWRITAAAAGTLATTEKFTGDYEVIVDYKTPKDAAAARAGIGLGGGAPIVAESTDGRWVRASLQVRGDSYSLTRQGRDASRGDLPAGGDSGRAVQLHATAPGVEFANLYVRALPPQ